MSNAIPLIRSAILTPFVRWMSDTGLDVQKELSGAGLGWISTDNPMAPIPVGAAARLLSNLSAKAGPDTPRRIVGRAGAFQLGPLSTLILTTKTPRGAFLAAREFMPFHSTHELLSVEETAAGLVLESGWFLRFDRDDALHLVQQFFISVIESICEGIGETGPFTIEASMIPHPRFGLDHMKEWMGDRIHHADGRTLSLVLGSETVDRGFAKQASGDFQMSDLDGIEPLFEKATLTGSVEALVTGMLAFGNPGIDAVAECAQMSRRSLQRHLVHEGAIFSDIVENVRFRLAQKHIASGDLTLKQISEALGYRHQETLTRALRRWRDEEGGTSDKR